MSNTSNNVGTDKMLCGLQDVQGLFHLILIKYARMAHKTVQVE